VDITEASASLASLRLCRRKFRPLSERLKVRYAMFLFHDQVDEWWCSIHGELPSGDSELLWSSFLGLFFEQFFPSSERERRAVEFARLVLGVMMMVEYEQISSSLQ
ncbi:hypothetical protein ACLOJK_036379, partial [Asimina triloba]